MDPLTQVYAGQAIPCTDKTVGDDSSISRMALPKQTGSILDGRRTRGRLVYLLDSDLPACDGSETLAQRLYIHTSARHPPDHLHPSSRDIHTGSL